ncbi:hypothetical protein SDC9_20806 [bioreactor metagenome]|uniref:Uncharacterized protein n=1 Tax=bioreactor metagenome TaxID=1076179 RepID=A0A644U7Q9_9ZZZZ|nr:hypothetical protein [Desulfitobacterium hafniense]MEA5024579.1 hypothetical protein [Desulfitobacterium hafniense]
MQRGRTPYGMKQEQISALGFGIVVILIIIYLVYHFFSKGSYYSLRPSLAATSSMSYPSSYQTSNLSPYSYPRQGSSNVYDPNNTYNSNNTYDYSTQNSLTTSDKNNVLTGYWILFDMNGVITQFNLSSNDYAFVQRLIQNDNKGVPKIRIFLVENGQTRHYIVSNELYTIIANMNYIVDSRSVNNPVNPSNYGIQNTIPNSYSNSYPYASSSSNSNLNSSSSNPNLNSSSSNSTYNQAIKP